MKPNNIELQFCPICDGKNLNLFKVVKDYSTTKEDFSLSQCDSCGFVFTNPIPDENSIGRYYDSPAYISHTNIKKGLFASLYQNARAYAIKKKINQLSKYLHKGSRILDYGSGTGEFLNACSTAGFHVTGVEVSDKARASAIKNYNLKVLAPSEFDLVPNESLDAITMWHVLEHLPNLKESLLHITSKMKKGAILVLALPNRESEDANTYGEYWAAWDVPIHFYHFVKKDIERIAAYFNLETIETINMPLDSFYVSLLSEQYRTGKKRWLPAFWNGLKSNAKGARSKNMSSLTYILRKL